MKTIFVTLSIIAFLIMLISSLDVRETVAKEEMKLDGKTLFLGKMCSGCHSIQAMGIARRGGGTTQQQAPDLSAVGSKHNAKFIMKWLRQNESIRAKKHSIKFIGSDEELKVLAEWLASLKPDSSQTSDHKK